MFTFTFALTAALAIGAFAQDASSSTTSARTSAMITASPSSSGSAQTTITALVGSMTDGFGASIVNADACQTTMAISCTADTYVCNLAEGIEFTVTQGPTIYEVAYETSTAGGSVMISQSCDLDGPAGSFTQAVCVQSVMYSVAGTSTATKTTETISGAMTDFQYGAIGVTAGAEKLPSGPATCTDSSSGMAAPTGIAKEIYKVIVPVGAVLAAGAMM